MLHSDHSALDTPEVAAPPLTTAMEFATARGMRLRDNHATPRRLRISPPQPEKTRLKLIDRDHRIFELLNRHGPLPTTYIRQMIGGSKTHVLERLCDLYHGVMWMGQHVSYLSKPRWQEDNKNAYWGHLIYDLTDYSRQELRKRGVLVINRESEHPLHRFMGACCTASLKIYIESRMLEYHDLYRLLCHEKCPQTTRELDNPLAISREPEKDEKLYDKKGNKIEHVLIPDDLFAIQGDTVKPTFYAVEIDRGTETTIDTARTSLGRKFKHYDAAIDNRSFKAHFGFPGTVKVLIITNSRTRRDNLARYYKKHGKHPGNFLFSYTEGEGFDYGWGVPPLLFFEWVDGNGEKTTLV